MQLQEFTLIFAPEYQTSCVCTFLAENALPQAAASSTIFAFAYVKFHCDEKNFSERVRLDLQIEIPVTTGSFQASTAWCRAASFWYIYCGSISHRFSPQPYQTSEPHRMAKLRARKRHWSVGSGGVMAWRKHLRSSEAFNAGENHV